MSACREDLMGIGYRMWTSADEREGGRSAYKYEHENAGVDAELSTKLTPSLTPSPMALGSSAWLKIKLTASPL
jgi:hypothetical protein